MKYRKIEKYKYQLEEAEKVAVPWAVEFDIFTKYIKLKDGIITIYKYYAWNGANVIPDTKKNMLAALVHDALYQLMRLNLIDYTKYRDLADQTFRDICIENGNREFWANLCYTVLKWFGESFAKPPKETEVEIFEI